MSVGIASTLAVEFASKTPCPTKVVCGIHGLDLG